MTKLEEIKKGMEEFPLFFRTIFGILLTIVVLFSVYHGFIFYETIKYEDSLRDLEVKCYNKGGISLTKDKTNFFCAKDFHFIVRVKPNKEDNVITEQVDVTDAR